MRIKNLKVLLGVVTTLKDRGCNIIMSKSGSANLNVSLLEKKKLNGAVSVHMGLLVFT